MKRLLKFQRNICLMTACAFDDPRLHIFYEDGLKYIRSAHDKYDLIIVDSTDPFGPGEGLFTREFYGNCYKALHEDGILINQHESPFYEEDAMAWPAGTQTDRGIFPLKPGLSGAYSNLSVRSLAFWLFIQEISSSERS